jgi:hypothetical protein
MWAHVKATINRLKNTSKRRTIDRRRLCDRVNYWQQRVVCLEAENERLRRIADPWPVFNHKYPAQMIALAVFIVINGGSLRCAAASAQFLARLMEWPMPDLPSPVTVRNWVLRCGLHALQSVRDWQGEMVLVMDESIQIGTEKLILLLGIPLSKDHCRCTPLTSEDVRVLGMEVQHSWTGDLIADFVRRTLASIPKLKVAYFISDRGTSMLAAIRQLGYSWVSDCSHEMMNAVKDIFKDDKALQELCAAIGALRSRFLLTDWGGLLPPTLRDKDRFLRLFTLVDWVRRLDTYWEKLPGKARRVLSFYRRQPALLRRLIQVRDLVEITAKLLKAAGLSTAAHQRWQQQVQNFLGQQESVSHAARKFIKRLEAYFAAHAPAFEAQGRLLCCSDIIESTFGRYKNKGGMKAISADVLSIALYNQPIGIDYVIEALGKVSEPKLKTWEEKNVCHNFLGLRRRLDQELKNTG